MDAIDRLNDEGRLRDCRAECEEFKAAKRREYEARQRVPKDAVSGTSAVNGGSGADRREEGRREGREESDPERDDRSDGMTERAVKNGARREPQVSVEAMRAELAAARRTAAEAVRSAEQANAELEAMERNAARLEKKLAVVSRALESAVALVGTLLPLGAD
jgi:chromosome segregation ATPase